MEVYFQNRHLEKLYTTGWDKKYPLEDHVIDSFFEVVAIIQAAKNIYDFRNQPSLKFEGMISTEKSYSFRLNRKFRLEVTIDWENKEKTIGIIGIEEISVHYR
ncbi:MAG: type II toxin-antitoxin system RelE/ParE family toxin [Sphaerochaetaceae bacterium]|nr:type II toxin-antitoxin system RelE/ParE family toxin [Sphaerochaetaceae bacterium]